MPAALIVSTMIVLLLVLIWGLQRRLIYLPAGTARFAGRCRPARRAGCRA